MKNKTFGFILLALFLHGCAAAPTVRVPQEALLKDLCSQYNVDWSWDSVSQVVTLSRGGLKAKAMVGSDLVVVGDDKISLSAPLKRKRGSVIVPGDFKRKVIDSLIQEISRVLKKFQNIVIDPGHGGKDPGAIGRGGLKEKTVVLDISRRLKSSLEKEGVNVTLTRERDEFISLEDRARLANKLKADLFVSIHANSSHARGVRGLEVYYMRDLDTASLREAHQASNYKEMFRRLSMKQDNPDLERILLGMMYAHKQSESRKLARYLARNLSNGINSNDRGSKSAGFVVLKDTLIPAVLIEVGFLSNKSEEDLLSTSSHRDQIADSLTKSILEYANQ